MTLGEFFKNLKEENEEIINYKPEDYDKYINIFVNAKKKLEILISQKRDIRHYNNKIIDIFEELRKTLIKSYSLKEKTHQNTTLVKSKYNNLIKAIFDYNNVLNDYKRVNNLDIKTIGDAFRALGQNTAKSSVFTEE